MNKILLSIWFVFFINIAHAQTLQEFIQRALDVNYQIQIVKNDEQIADNNNTRGNAGQLPTVDAIGAYTQNINTAQQIFFTGETREGNNAKSTNLSGQLVLNWTVFDGYRMFAEKKRLEYLEQISTLSARYFIEQTIADLVNLYYQLIFEQRELDNLNAILEISSYRLSLEEKRKSIGSGNILATRQALVDFENDEINVLIQQNKIKTLKIQFNNLVNYPPDSPVVTDSIIVLSMFDTANKQMYIDQIKHHNDNYLQKELEELMAESVQRIEKSYRYPTVNLFAGYGYGSNFNEVGFIKQSTNYGASMGINIRMNLFNGGKTNTMINNSRLEQQNTLFEKKFTKQSIENAGMQYLYEWESLLEQEKLSNHNVTTANQMLATAEEQFKIGAVSGYELRLSQLSLLHATQRLNQIRLNKAILEINLNRLSGNVLKAYMN